MKLSKAQEEIVMANEPKIVVCASAASGKSTILVARIQRLIDEGVNPEQIVALTFTNSAAENILDRLVNSNGIFVGTIHSYINNLLKKGGVDTSSIIQTEQFDKLFEKITKNIECIVPVEHLLLDEAQDSTERQFEVLLDYIKPKNWFLVGDWRQSIYGFCGARPDILIDISCREGVKTYELSENYRNGKKILDYAKGIIRLAGLKYRDSSYTKYDCEGCVIDREMDFEEIARSIAKKDDYSNWFILTRANADIDIMSRFLKKYNVPFDSFKRSQLNTKELNNKLKENTVKLLTIHAAKGLEADNVIVIGARYFNLEEICISYVAATRARNLLVWVRAPKKRRRIESWI